MMTGSPFNISGISRKNIFWKFRQSRQEGGVVGEWGAESGKCATILCAHINAVRGNCARSHYEPSLTCEQWDHSASFASTWCLARKGQNKSRSLFPTSNIQRTKQCKTFINPEKDFLSREQLLMEEVPFGSVLMEIWFVFCMNGSSPSPCH